MRAKPECLAKDVTLHDVWFCMRPKAHKGNHRVKDHKGRVLHQWPQWTNNPRRKTAPS